jgi:hypothetical protein
MNRPIDMTGWLDAGRRGLGDVCRRLFAWFRAAEPWKQVLAVGLGLLLLAMVLPVLMMLALLALLVALGLFWVGEFVTLMRLPDAAFPGRHDKLVWAAAMIALAPVGLPAFFVYRHIRWPDGPPTGRAEAAEKPASPWTDEDWP